LALAGLCLIGALTNLAIFDSVWFAILGSLLMLNIIICSLNRWRGIKLAIRGGTVKQKESFYAAGGNCTELSAMHVPLIDTVRMTERILKSRGYRVRTEIDEDNVYVAADKNRFFRIGTYLSHFSLILFVFAFITGGHFGFRESSFVVPVGDTREVGHNTGLALQLISFVDEYYDNGMPKDYRSQVILYKNGNEVKQAFIRVNHPLTYQGIRFYQAFFGPSAEIQVRQEETVIFHGNVPLDSTLLNGGNLRYVGLFDLQKDGIVVRLVSSAVNADDSMIPNGQLGVEVIQNNKQIGLKLMKLNDSQLIGGLEYTFLGESQYSGFQVSKDPTNSLIWIASILFTIGISAVLYFPYRYIWVLVKARSQKDSSLFIRSLPSRSFGNTSEMRALVNQIEKELQISEDKRT
jgi:cytochrome c biogenesis protein